MEPDRLRKTQKLITDASHALMKRQYINSLLDANCKLTIHVRPFEYRHPNLPRPVQKLRSSEAIRGFYQELDSSEIAAARRV